MNSFVQAFGFAIYILFVVPFSIFGEELTRRAAAINLAGCVVAWGIVSYVLNDSFRVGAVAWAVYCIGCFIIYICYEDKILAKKKAREEEERNERMRQQLKDLGIDPDKPVTLNINLYSLNNKALKSEYTEDEMKNVALQIENTALHEQRTIEAEYSSQVEDIAEEVFRLWARQEKEPDYLCTLDNYAKRPPKSYRVAEVVGMDYRSKEAQKRYNELRDGEKVLLVKESNNPYDENAVKVVSQDGYHMGFLARDYAKKYKNILKELTYGWHYHYDEHHDFYNTVRIYRHYMEYERERDPFVYE